MADILKELLEFFPEGKISDAGFEGANIMLYTTDKNFFLNNEGIIRKVVSHFKKRVELRPDPSITMDPEKAKAIIEQIIPQEAKMDNIIFDKFRSQVIIETEKPGLCIGKQGALLQEIREKTYGFLLSNEHRLFAPLLLKRFGKLSINILKSAENSSTEWGIVCTTAGSVQRKMNGLE